MLNDATMLLTIEAEMNANYLQNIGWLCQIKNKPDIGALLTFKPMLSDQRIRVCVVAGHIADCQALLHHIAPAVCKCADLQEEGSCAQDQAALEALRLTAATWKHI